MDKQQRMEDIAKYIEKYYVPENDDIDVNDAEVKGFFSKISEFLARRKLGQKEDREEQPAQEIASTPPVDGHSEFDMSTAKKEKIIRPMSEMTISNRKIADLMSQMDETFSQRLVRMIRERNMSESEAYKKAYVDRRHFYKIKKDDYYMPNKKTVLAFAIALELSLDETKDLLRSAGYALSRSSKFDIIIVYFLENHIYNMFDINDILYEYDLPIFK